jgi:hypothetical protein
VTVTRRARQDNMTRPPGFAGRTRWCVSRPRAATTPSVVAERTCGGTSLAAQPGLSSSIIIAAGAHRALFFPFAGYVASCRCRLGRFLGAVCACLDAADMCPSTTYGHVSDCCLQIFLPLVQKHAAERGVLCTYCRCNAISASTSTSSCCCRLRRHSC